MLVGPMAYVECRVPTPIYEYLKAYGVSNPDCVCLLWWHGCDKRTIYVWSIYGIVERDVR